VPVDEPPGIAFLLQQRTRGGEAVDVGDGVGLGHAGHVGDGGDEVFADAFHRPRAAGFGHVAGIDVFGQDGAGRIGQDEFHVRGDLAEVARQPGQRAGRADADHDGVHVVAHLFPDFRAGGGFMRQRIGGIVELV